MIDCLSSLRGGHLGPFQDEAAETAIPLSGQRLHDWWFDGDWLDGGWLIVDNVKKGSLRSSGMLSKPQALPKILCRLGAPLVCAIMVVQLHQVDRYLG